MELHDTPRALVPSACSPPILPICSSVSVQKLPQSFLPLTVSCHSNEKRCWACVNTWRGTVKLQESPASKMRQQKTPCSAFCSACANEEGGFCFRGMSSVFTGLEEERSGHGTGLSHQRRTWHVWRILQLSRSLWKEGVGSQCVHGALGEARRAEHDPSITTHSSARAGGAQGPSPPLLTRTAGTVMGASGWGNDLWENFLWKILISLCCGLQSKEKIWHPPSSTPPSSPQGFTANIRSLDRRRISGDCALRTKNSPNIFKHFPAEVGVERKQSTEGMLIAPF